MVGATARYGLARWWPVAAGHFPWATFAVNLTGSALLGVVLAVLAGRPAASGRSSARSLRPFLATGVLGAYTTMSTYVVEVALLVRDGDAGLAAGYASASVVLGLLCAWAGVRAGRWARRGGPAAGAR